MDPTRITLFDLAQRRLAWTEQRQAVLAQNIANADTPGWQSRDLAPFAAMADQAGVDLARTDPGHLVGTSNIASSAKLVRPTGRQPDGNAVSLDQELTKVADTDTTQSLVSAIYHTYLGLFRTAIGQGVASG